MYVLLFFSVIPVTSLMSMQQDIYSGRKHMKHKTLHDRRSKKSCGIAVEIQIVVMFSMCVSDMRS